MNEHIHTTRFPEIEVHYDNIGVGEKTGNPQQARIRFEQALRARGYAPAGNSTWIRDGYTAVMIP